jgi:ribosomal protein S18 acetylase RimI-like enzyme
MMFRKAAKDDLGDVAALYEKAHDEEEAGLIHTGWQRGVYPTAETVQAALDRDDLFVAEQDGRIIGAAVINQIQVDVYESGAWEYAAPDDRVMVLHTLFIDPAFQHRGIGRAFIDFYEKYAVSCGCAALRMDTNEINLGARALYKKLGYKEIGKVPTEFNGIRGVMLILLEKPCGEQ